MAKSGHHDRLDILAARGAIDRDRPEPLHRQLVDYLRTTILEAAVKPDEQFPTETQISEAFAISRHTARQALAKLEQEGLLVRQRGRGTFVRPFVRSETPAGRSARHGRIGLIMPWEQANFFSRLMVDVENIMHEHGYRTMLVNNWDDPEKELGRVREMLDHGVDAAIWMCPQDGSNCTTIRLMLENLDSVVAVDRIPGNEEGQVSFVEADNRGGMAALTRYLVEKGHRQFALVTDRSPSLSSPRLRRAGFQMALQEAEIDISPDCFFASRRRGIEAGRLCAGKILRSGKSFDAICCITDQLAVGVIHVLQENGLSVPDDIAVTGFTDDAACMTIKPHLTTVRIDIETIGTEAARLLLKQLEKKERNEVMTTVHMTVPVKLVMRDSA